MREIKFRAWYQLPGYARMMYDGFCISPSGDPIDYFTEPVKRLRQIRGWTQTRLADELGVTQQTVSLLECGNLRLSQELAQRITEIFQIKIKVLFPDITPNTIRIWGEWRGDSTVILMQYTGLKDKNKREIYEADILSFAGNMTADNTMGSDPNGYIYDENSKHVVIWDDTRACWSLNFNEDDEWKYKRDTYALMLDATAIEIIGNIYENPEIIKK